MKFIKLNICLALSILTHSSLSIAQVNCNQDFTNGVNLIIEADHFVSESKKLDKKHEAFLIDNEMTQAKDALYYSIRNAQEAIKSYVQAKKLLEGVVEYKCWRKVKKSNNKISYINLKLTKTQETLEILEMINNYL